MVLCVWEMNMYDLERFSMVGECYDLFYKFRWLEWAVACLDYFAWIACRTTSLQLTPQLPLCLPLVDPPFHLSDFTAANFHLLPVYIQFWIISHLKHFVLKDLFFVMIFHCLLHYLLAHFSQEGANSRSQVMIRATKYVAFLNNNMGCHEDIKIFIYFYILDICSHII